jgi:hypothetical protein
VHQTNFFKHHVPAVTVAFPRCIKIPSYSGYSTPWALRAGE